MHEQDFVEKVQKFKALLETIKSDALKLTMACIVLSMHVRMKLAALYAADDMSGKLPERGVALASIVYTMAKNLHESNRFVFVEIGAITIKALRASRVERKKLWLHIEQEVDNVVKKAIVADGDKRCLDFFLVAAAWFFVFQQLVHDANVVGCMEGTMAYIATKIRISKKIPWIPKVVFEELEAALSSI